MEITEVLYLIDEYIDALEDWETTSAYDKGAKDFFGFLKEYGANVGAVISIIKAATGSAPIQIRNRGEAESIREFLRRTYSSEALGRRIPSDDLNFPGRWAQDNVSFAFDQREDDPYESI